MDRGRVSLVGAGPGDPKLLTLRAVELLAQADVVAHDSLISAAVLRYANPKAERLHVGRRHGDGPSQHRIHPEVIRLARAGKHVVRLKCGDPMVFGRGAEEAEALTEAGIPWEIVPGISAALGAAAHTGIPLTHRDHASDVTFVTGHDADSTYTSRTRWQHLAQHGGTLVLFMASRSLDDNLARLVQHGRSADTPAAYIAAATMEHQQVVVGTLANLANLVQRTSHLDRRAPALIIVGDVVRAYHQAPAAPQVSLTA